MTPAEYNRSIPMPGEYARSWKILASLHPSTIVSVPGWIVGMSGWGNQSVHAGVSLARVREALDRRINARAGYTPREPREETYRLARDARAALDRNVRRIRVYQFETREARRRLGHLLASRED